MSVLKLSKNDIIKGEDQGGKLKLKKSDIITDTTQIGRWEIANRQSLDILNDYNNRINKSEWLDEEDRKSYRKALDSYIETSNLLRGISKTFGEGYSVEDEQKWADSIANMNKGYDDITGFYSQFADDREYNNWYASETKRKEYESTLAAEDFDIYSSRGRGVENPTWEQAQPPINIFGWTPVDGKEVNNIVTFAESFNDKSNRYAALQKNPNGEYNEIVGLVLQMTEDEKNIYNYYIGRGEKEKADAYIDYMSDILRRRQAGNIVEAIDNTALEAVFSFAAGVENAFVGLGNIDNLIMGTEGDPTTTMQYAQGSMSQNNEGIWKVTNDLLNTTGNMLPSILVGTVTGGLGGAVTLGVSASGNAYSEMRKLGYDEWQSRGYAALTGASEAVLSYALGGISKLGGGNSGIFQTIAGKIVPKLDNAIARVAIQVGGNMLDEGLEEAVQEVLDPVFKMVATGEDFEGIDLEEVLYSGLLGALSAGMLEGVPTIAGNVLSTYNTNVANGGLSVGEGIKATFKGDLKNAFNAGRQNVTESAGYYVNEALEIDPDNAHAQRMQSRINDGKNVSGYQINRLVEANENALVSQDKDKIKAAAEAQLTKLGEKGNVSEIAEAISKHHSGEKLTKAEQALIANSTYGRRVSNGLNPDNIMSGEYDTSWAESIGTERINTEAYNRGISEASEASVEQVETASAPENSPAKENAAEAKNKASVGDAKIATTAVAKATMVDNEGNNVEAKVAKIAEVENGESTLELEGGQTVKASDVDFGDSGIGLVYNTATEMVSGVGGFNVDAANVMVRGFNANGNIKEAVAYVSGFNEAYRYGAMGYPVSALASGNATSKLSVAQREAAYNLGKAYGIGKVAEKQANIDSKKAKKTGQKAKKGKVYFDGSTVGKSLTERQRASLKGLRVVAEAMGIDIHIFESDVVDGERQGANGWYDPSDNSIHIDLHAGVDGNGVMLFTASHELTHHIREVAPAKFKVFADALLEEYTKNGVSLDALIEEKLEHLERNGRLEGKTEAEAYDLAYEEVVADAAEAMLVDSDAIEALSKKLQAKDKGLWETIKDFIAKLVNRIKAAYEGLDPDSAEGKAVREMKDSAERLQKLWVDALLEASEVGDSVDIEAQTDNGVKYMDRKVDNSSKKRYNKRLIRDEFATNAMIWAHSDKTAVGEQKLFYRKGQWVLLEKSDDGFVEMGTYSDKQRNIIAEEIKVYNEELHKQRSSERAEVEGVRESIVFFRSIGGSDTRNNINGMRGSSSNEQVGGLYRGKSYSDRSRGNKSSKYDIGRNAQKLDENYLSAVNRGDTETAQKMVDEAAKAAGYTVKAYHGTSRGDRVGNVFLPERATSGPMAFFTDNKDIADNYAKNKSDTSLAYDTEYDSYYTQFRVNRNGKSVSIPELWNHLSYSEKSSIKEKAKHIKFDDDYENIIVDRTAEHGNGAWDAYTLNLHKGNALEALVDTWLESGDLYNQEADFIKVLELVGISDVEYRNPDARYEKTYDTWLKIQKPFDTDNVNQAFYESLSEWIETHDMSVYEKETSNADMWDKNNQSPESWLDKLSDDIENGTTHAWTVIPDFVTDYLKQQRYDGIKDKGGKGGGAGHTVWIPFSSEQIKSAEPVTYDDKGEVIPLSERFNSKNIDIRYSDREKSSYAPTFYSHMGKVIDDIKLDKMGASSILNHLKNRGVKAEELKWSGIETFLEGKKSVTKAELQEFVAGSQLQIEETNSGINNEAYTELDNLWQEHFYSPLEDVFDPEDFDETTVSAQLAFLEENGMEMPSEDIQQRMIVLAHKIGKPTRWEQYKLNGGSNYRELVFKMPTSTYSNRAMRGHWGQDAEGVLAHARIQDFEVDGKKMLFIEEIQSDWHNEGHSKGYTTKEYEDAVAVYDKLAEAYASANRAFNRYVRSSEFNHDPEDVRKKKFDWLRNKMESAEKRMQLAEKDVDSLKEKGMGDVPDAPFRDTYHEYVLKRLLRMAAEEGYDSIGWTTADIQSERWSEDYAEGYRIEYDQDIPKFLNKYGKKWGAKVGTTSLADEELQSRIKEHQELLDSAIKNNIIEDIRLWTAQLKKLKVRATVHSFDISDSMKESVLYEGQPLYSDRRAEVKGLRAELEKESIDSASVISIADSYLSSYGGEMNKSEMHYDFLHAMKTMAKGTQEAYENASEEIATIAAELAYNPKDLGGMANDLKEIKKYVRDIKFRVHEQDKGEFDIYGGFGTFRKKHMGKLTLANNGISVDSVYMELQGLYGTSYFPDVNTVAEQLMVIAEVVDTPLSSVAEFDYDPDDASAYVAEEIFAKFDKLIISGFEKAKVQATKEAYINYRNPDSYSNRSLLAGALEGAVQNDIERQKLAQYKQKIDLINSEEQKLHDLREQIRELSFKKGPRDTEAIRQLQFEANQAANRINTYDKQLLNLESTKALKGVLEREKALARKRDAQKYKEAIERYREKSAKAQRELMDRYQESRQRGVENRNKTAMRHKIKDVVNELNNYLLKGTKDKHVPIELQKAVAEALDAVNMDTVGAEERIARLKAEMMKAKTPEAIQEIAKKIEHIEEMGGNMAKKIARLKTAYDSIINSDDPLVANSHDEVISNTIQRVGEIVGETPLRDMSLNQLEEVYDMYRMVLFTIRNANKAFKAAKSEEISVIANRVMEEVDKLGKRKSLQTKAGEAISSFDWNNQKPIYAFERIGSDTFTDVFNNVRAGEDAWARDMTEAQTFREEQYKKHKYDSWDFKKRFGFTSSSGMQFELTLPQIMSLYAYSKRDQAAEHLKRGGIVFDETTEVTVKNKLGIPVKFNPTQATAYNLSDETLADIISKLTTEQKAFVDEMQDYLSTTMGEKGNEVSLELYGVKLFKEKHYFPLKSATQFMAKAKEQQKGEVKIKNSGFTKETVNKANNPIVLTPFMDVWAGHVNEMSMYHAFTLALEDFYRVYNYKTPTSETMATESVEMFLQNAHGKGATKYIDQLLKDLNGGARVDSTAGIINKLTGLFKKSAVFASASVVIQQPSAIARATALVDTKYFVGAPSGKKHSETWAEVKKFAPVAVIKEMGYFDTGMGRSSVEWLKGEKTLMDKVDDIASKAPALADEYAWCAIWNAVKRETVHNNPGLKTSSDEFLTLVGERFTEVVTKTQVYDSVLSRSANMRSKDTGMKMATAFMGEPTTSLNMLQNALIQGKRGNKKAAAKAVGGVISSMILNSILVSIVYAGRDDDEEKTYAEKYISTLTEELLDSFNPLTLIPFVKDIVSIAQGYDVERSDMAVITDLINAWDKLDSDNRSVYRKVEDFGGAIAAIFGLPVKNVMRDVRGMYNTINGFINGEETTEAGIGNAVKEAITGKETSNTQLLYEAMVKGDSAQVKRIEGRFEDQKAIDTALRKALRENDPRMREAAQAYLDGDYAKYNSLRAEIVAEGVFSNQLVTDALKAEYNYLKNKAKEE